MESVMIDDTMTRIDEQAYLDMGGRVTTHNPCLVEFMPIIPPCYPYGTLYLAPTTDNMIIAAFGDLRVLVSPQKAFALIAMAMSGSDLIAVCFAMFAFLAA